MVPVVVVGVVRDRGRRGSSPELIGRRFFWLGELVRVATLQ